MLAVYPVFCHEPKTASGRRGHSVVSSGMDENREPRRRYELIQWRTLGCLIPALFIWWLLCAGLPYFLAD
jgi:hypothetical protein